MEKSVQVVGLMADPGVPMRIAEEVAAAVERDLVANVEGDWRVDLSERRLPLHEDGTIPLFAEARTLRETSDWDYLVYLTDLPRIHDREIALCEVSASEQAAIISIPSSGILRPFERVRRLVTELVTSAETNTYERPSNAGLDRVLGGRRFIRRANPELHDTVSVYLPGTRNRISLLLGMIRSNQPGRLLVTLTNAFAIAFATGAFGIFYGSIWDLSDALPPWRLLLISVSAVIVLGAWLIVRNGLWARGRSPAAPWQRGLDNAATVITLSVSVLLFHATLIVVLFLLATIVIQSDYLATQLVHPVGVTDYIQLSWLSASMGTLAGALGTNFNSEESIREATYSRRVYERRKLANSFEDE